MSWINQGRQEHGWFGDGTAAIAEKPPAARGREPPAADGLDQRIAAIIHGSIAAMPRGARPQAERLAAGDSLPRLKEILKALASPDIAPSREGRGDPVVTALRAAARNAAGPGANPRAGSEHLAAAIQVVGPDRWPGFLRDVTTHAETLARQAGNGTHATVQKANAGAVIPLVTGAVAAVASALRRRPKITASAAARPPPSSPGLSGGSVPAPCRERSPGRAGG